MFYRVVDFGLSGGTVNWTCFGWRSLKLPRLEVSFTGPRQHFFLPPVFRSIFWFLCIATSACLIVMILYVKESVASSDVIERDFLSDSFRRRCGPLSMMAA